MPVAGSTLGTFSNPTGGSTASGSQWFYNQNNGFVTFSGVAFSGNTPLPFYFGSITLTNTSSQPNGTFSADMNLAVNFTTPNGQVVNFVDALQISAQSGGGASGHGDTLSFGSSPGPQSATSGAETYTVAYNGFFDSNLNMNTAVSSLFVANNPGGSATAYLWGTITSSPVAGTQSPVPEPGSVMLLGTVAGAIILALRRKRAHA
jgi:hypothetical protein